MSPDSKFHVAHMGPTWVLSTPGGPHVGPMNLAIRVIMYTAQCGLNIMSSSIYWLKHLWNITFPSDQQQVYRLLKASRDKMAGNCIVNDHSKIVSAIRYVLTAT